MRGFLFLLLVVTAGVLVIGAVVFRSTRAKDTLRFVRNAAWLYIAMIVLLAAFRLWFD